MAVRPLASLLLAALLLAAPACRRTETLSEASADAARYPIEGVIRGVDREKPAITLEHEEIKGYMAAMTMTFAVRETPQALLELEVGKRIAGTLVVDGDRSWIEGISASPAARPPSLAVATPEPNKGVAPGDEVPDFSLTDQNGKIVRLSKLRGEAVAVTFLYTRCPIATACPMTTAKFSKLAAMLEKKPVGRLLVVTVEPEHDTPEVLSEYARKAGADGVRWRFLTGSPKAVAEVATSFGVVYYPDRGQIIHSQAVAVVDPKGRLSTIYYGENWEPEHILRDMEKARQS
jgi:protein SCO1/2